MLITVRREKAPVHSGRQTRPGTGSLQPVAIGVTAEATKPLEMCIRDSLKTGGSALALNVSRPAQRLLTLWPARSPSRHRDPLHRRLRRLRYLCSRFDCYRVERTSSRAGLSPAVDRRLFTAHSYRQVTVNLGIVSNPVLAFQGPWRTPAWVL